MYRKAFELARSLLILYLMLYLGGLVAHYVPIGIPSSVYLLNCAYRQRGVGDIFLSSFNSLYGAFVCAGQCGNRQIFRLAHGSNERIISAEYGQYLRDLGCDRFTV